MRRALYTLPALTMVVVAIAVFVLGAERPYVVARVYGGPTEEQTKLGFRLVVSQRGGAAETAYGPVAVRVSARTDAGATFGWRGDVDARGVADVVLDGAPRHALDVSIWVGAAEVPSVQGRLALTRGAWLARGSRRGGLIAGATRGDLVVEAAPARGVFVIGFADPLLIQVRRGNAAVAGAELAIEPEGALVNDSVGKITAVVNRNGRALVNVTPQEPGATLRVVASARGSEGTWQGVVPVVQGALHARPMKSVLVVESPVEGRDAFVSFIDPGGRVAGALPALRRDGRGGAIAIVPLPPDRGAPLWAVLSSDADLRSPATLGWPLADPERLLGEHGPLPDTAFAWTVPDALLLDGAPAAHARELGRRKSAQRLAVSMAVVSFLLIAAIVAWDAYRSRLPRELQAGEPRAALALPLLPWLLVALLSIALGFAVVTLVAYLRLA